MELKLVYLQNLHHHFLMQEEPFLPLQQQQGEGARDRFNADGKGCEAIGVDRYSGSPKNRVVHVSYIRESDNKRWLQKCKVEENRVIWASDMLNEGYHRWRNHPGDERIEFTRVEEGRFMMNLKHPDGSGDSREYSFVGE
ncbi:hypothetical protein M8S30_004424 [Salmonella enterica]|nr:hypothetical protein [Salmonella enterica]EJF5298731.1 hypothetical protein [Salmonella enterica]